MILRARISILVFLLSVLVCSGSNVTAAAGSTASAATASAAATTAADSLAVRGMMAQMSLEDKVGQLFVIRPEARNCKAQPAGYCLFATNIENPRQLDSLTRALKAGKYAPMLCIDEEGGRVARIGSNSAFGVTRFRNAALESPKGRERIKHIGSQIGSYLKRYGFDVDFAPVVDVNTNPDNPVIGQRSYSSDPAVVTEMAEAFLEGLQENSVAGCLKHYPGHGDTSTDSHNGYAGTDKTWDQMLQCELIPFIDGIKKGVPMIMVGHVTAVNVDPSSLPSTLSYTLVTEKLRGELGYRGIIISDSLGMGAVSQNNTASEVSVKAFLAGIDILLMPSDFRQAYNGVLEAVRGGSITMDRLDESVFRILMLKRSLGKL